VVSARSADVAHFDYVGSERSLIVTGKAGVRFMVTKKFAFDAAYNLMCRHDPNIGFTGTTMSILTFGFSRTF